MVLPNYLKVNAEPFKEFVVSERNDSPIPTPEIPHTLDLIDELDLEALHNPPEPLKPNLDSLRNKSYYPLLH